MKVISIQHSGNSSKFRVYTKRGEFTVTLSYTLRTSIWKLADDDAELVAAEQLGEAIVSRHDPALPFKPLYIFAEHNSEPTLDAAVQRIRRYGIDREVS